MSHNTFMVQFQIIIALFLSAGTIYYELCIPNMNKLDEFLSDIQQKPNYVTPDQIPNDVKLAFMAAEDNFFYSHHGVDYKALSRATYVYLSTGKKKQGGSTITMQLARNVYLNQQKTFLRKFKEILIAYKIEHQFNKDEIMALYLNKIYFGHNKHGIKQASLYYFSKKVPQLNVAQATTLAVIPPAPSQATPILTPDKIMKKRNRILNRLLDLRAIPQQAYDKAIRTPLIQN